MSKYKVVSLNYISSGKNKTFINLDISSDFRVNASYRVLEGIRLSITGRQRILTEQKDGYEKKQNFIAADTLGDINGCSGDVVINEESDRTRENARGISLSAESDMPNTGRMMADNINYSVSVSYEGMQLANEHSISSLLLDEEQPYMENTDGLRQCFRIYTEKDVYTYHEKLIKKLENLDNLRNRTYVFERTEEDSTDAGYLANVRTCTDGKQSKTRAMYDINDIALKSPFKQYGSFIRGFDKYDHTEDLYSAQQSENPVGFCQTNGYTYVMTGPNKNSFAMMRSSLIADREKNVSQTWYRMCIQNDSDNSICYYNPPYDMVINKDDPDFSIRLTQSGIESQIIQRFSMADGYDYTNGNDYCNSVQTKSFYDANYDMDSRQSEDGDTLSILGCREYVGIGQYDGNVYAKYNDNVSYVCRTTKYGEDSTSKMEKSGNVGYQKIETVLQNRSDVVKNHKSNFFSVRIWNTKYGNPDRYSNVVNDIRYQQAKKDIMNAIRKIVDNVSPVNTTMIDVQFR